MGKRYVQGKFLDKECLGEKYIWVKNMYKKKFWVKSL